MTSLHNWSPAVSAGGMAEGRLSEAKCHGTASGNGWKPCLGVQHRSNNDVLSLQRGFEFHSDLEVHGWRLSAAGMAAAPGRLDDPLRTT